MIENRNPSRTLHLKWTKGKIFKGSRNRYYQIWEKFMITELENLPEQLNSASVFIDENIQEGKGDNVAIYFGEETLTYHDVFNMVNKTGNALKNLGVNMEERVMLMLLDSPEFIASFFGAMKIGAMDWRSCMKHEKPRCICNTF
jgi:hypothetical protein